MQTREGLKQQKKLLQKSEKELAALPDKVDAIEKKIAAIHDDMASRGFFEKSADHQRAVQANLKRLEDELAALFSPWEELENPAGEI